MFFGDYLTTYVTLFLLLQGWSVFAQLPPGKMSIETMPTLGAKI